MRKIGDMAYGLYAAKNRDAGLFDKKAVAKNDLSDCPLVGFAEEEPPVGPVWWLSRAEKMPLSLRAHLLQPCARA